MRIGIDIACLATAKTGAGVYVRELLREFQRQRPAEDIVLLQPKGYPLAGRNPLVKIWNNLRLFLWIQIQLPGRLKRNGCRVLISPEYLAPRTAPVPRLVVVYDAVFLKRPQEYNALWRLLFRWVYLPAMRSAEKIITITEVAKNDVSNAFALAPERIHIIASACNPELFHEHPEPEVRRTLRKYGLEPGVYFVHVGVLEKRKNLPALVRAFARVKSGQPDLRLVLAGQPGPKQDLDDSQNIARTVQELNLSSSVILPGFVPKEDLPLLYQGAKAMVFPTLYEGFGIPVLEAFACGTPVACSDLPVLREVAQHAAVFFDPASEADMARALQELLADPPKCLALVRAGRERLQHYSWAKSAREFLALAEQAGAAKNG